MIHDLKEDFVAKVFELAEEELKKDYFTQYLSSYIEIVNLDTGTRMKVGVKPIGENNVGYFFISVPHNTSKPVNFSWTHDYTRNTVWTVKRLAKFFLMATDIATMIERVNRDVLKL